ncbi:hypothetical protein TorRG33x02_018950 [Trema orientale]|uniref:Uncharacterized protein n=1 Tax=Trema orientale TaxID=63057 RepID=A0A2P5FWC7_TREOI|nr:hypothetical protein TorRG33x02_018950 [Trema orientale]
MQQRRRDLNGMRKEGIGPRGRGDGERTHYWIHSFASLIDRISSGFSFLRKVLHLLKYWICETEPVEELSDIEAKNLA